MDYKNSVSEIVKSKLLSQGKDGEKWLDNIGNTISLLERKWNVKVNEFLSGGSEALVAEVTTADDNKAIMKIVMPRQMVIQLLKNKSQLYK